MYSDVEMQEFATRKRIRNRRDITIFVIAVGLFIFGFCQAFLHPNEAGELCVGGIDPLNCTNGSSIPCKPILASSHQPSVNESIMNFSLTSLMIACDFLNEQCNRNKALEIYEFMIWGKPGDQSITTKVTGTCDFDAFLFHLRVGLASAILSAAVAIVFFARRCDKKTDVAEYDEKVKKYAEFERKLSALTDQTYLSNASQGMQP